MILSGEGTLDMLPTRAASDGGEGVHPTPRPRPFRASMLTVYTAAAGTSVSGGMYGSGRTDGRAGGRAAGPPKRSFGAHRAAPAGGAARIGPNHFMSKKPESVQKGRFHVQKDRNVFWTDSGFMDRFRFFGH